MKLRKRREEEDVITAVLYDDEEKVWKAKYAVDRGVCTIDFGSLDANFMQDTIGRCKRKRRKWVPIPQGSATGNTDQQSAVIQPSEIPTSEPGSVPGDLCVYAHVVKPLSYTAASPIHINGNGNLNQP